MDKEQVIRQVIRADKLQFRKERNFVYVSTFILLTLLKLPFKSIHLGIH